MSSSILFLGRWITWICSTVLFIELGSQLICRRIATPSIPLPLFFPFLSLSPSLPLLLSYYLFPSPFFTFSSFFFILFFFSPPFIEDSNFDLPTARAWERVIARSITVTVFFMSSHYSLLPLKLLYLCSMALSAFFMLEGWSSLRFQCLMAFLSVLRGRKGGREYLLEGSHR